MNVDSEHGGPPALHPSVNMGGERREAPGPWDNGLHRGLTRLDLNTPPQERDSAGAWANEVNQAVLARAEQARAAPVQPTVRFDTEVRTVHPPPQMPPSTGPPTLGSRHQYTMSAPSIATPRESKRHGWYHGPVTVHHRGETIPESRPHVDRIVHPNVSNFQGFPARDQPPAVHQQVGHGVDRMERIIERPHPASNARLEALVAVATSEGTAY